MIELFYRSALLATAIAAATGLNEQYSYRDYLQRDLRATTGWSGVIVRSCFQQDEPNTPIFPKGIRVTFDRCNLNNCKIPPGCIVLPNCCAHQHRLENDLAQWILGKDGKPAKPLKWEQFERLGLSTDPKDIPAEKVKMSVLQDAEEKAEKQERIVDLRKEADDLEKGVEVTIIPYTKEAKVRLERMYAGEQNATIRPVQNKRYGGKIYRVVP